MAPDNADADKAPEPGGVTPLSQSQLDKRNVSVPDLDPDDVQRAHAGGRAKIVNVGHITVGGFDRNGRRYNCRPGHLVELTVEHAKYLCDDSSSGKFEPYDPKKHGKLNKTGNQLEKPYESPDEKKRKATVAAAARANEKPEGDED